MQEQSPIQARGQRFLNELFRLPENSPVPLADFVRAAGYELIDSRERMAAPENGLTERKVKYAIQEVAPRLWPLEVVYEAGNIALRSTGTAFNRRRERAADTKLALGTALWDLLLGEDWRGNIGNSPPARILGNAEWLKKRIKLLRRRNLLYFSADGGTTTLAVIRQLLQATRIPIPLSIDLTKNISIADPRDVRIVDPVLLTNSIPIINEITNSQRHRHTFHVELVGGRVRANRQCATGDKSLLWLKTCNALGTANNLDLVILGVSGVCMAEGDFAYATCDDPAEASFKASLLQMCEGGKSGNPGGLRVLVLHAAKLLYPEARCRFATLNQGMIDLIVVDSGSDPDEKEAVRQLEGIVSQEGIAMLVV